MDYKSQLSKTQEETIKFALIGTSGIAPVYVKRLIKMKGVSLECVHSRSLERARSFASPYKISHFTNNLDNIFSDKGIQAVLIATEPERHVDIALQALLAEKHMLIEKPLDVTLQKAEELVSKAKGFKGVISVVSQKRFDPVLQEMKAHLSRDALGVPKTVQLSMMWHRDREYYRKGTGWREIHSPVFLNQGIHWLDVLNWFFGVPVRIQSTSRNTRSFLSCVDQTTAVIDYPDNTSVALCGGTFCDRSYPDRFTIYHSQGYLDYSELKNSREQEKRLHNRLISRFLKRKITRNKGEGALFSKQLKDFIEAIRYNRPPVTTLDNACQALKVAYAISQLNSGMRETEFRNR